MKEPAHIFAALEHNATHRPLRKVYSFVNEQGDIEQSFNWLQLKAKVDTLTGYLRLHHGLEVGDRVLLVYPPSIEFVVAFASCLRAGLIPVPVYPPNPARLDHGMKVFNSISRDCDAKLVLTSQSYATHRARKIENQTHMESIPGQVWDTSDHLQDGQWPATYGPQPEKNDIALIQYTSGSTSMPKGVVISHGNLVHQLEFTRKTLRTDENSEAVFWVPQYHDMGLIGGILNALGGHIHLTLFSPMAFIKRPALWFEIMHRVRATHTAAPNFAFELAVRKTTAEQRKQWDLSCLKMVMSAAEPVRASTSRLFLKTFAECGFNPSAYAPAYGLAEHTVGVTSNGGTIRYFDKSALESRREVRNCRHDDVDCVELVSSGSWPDDIDVRIVDPETMIECTSHQVGEVWVNSASKALGYWKQDEQSALTFDARICGLPDTGYLRTGDLGFVQDGQLYICGRNKDMLILAGRNIFPQDIEASLHQVDDAVRSDNIAAFAVEVEHEGRIEEKLVVLVELRQRRGDEAALKALAQRLQSAILEQHQLPCHALVLGPFGSVLKTTSGKVRRQACRQAWLDGSLQHQALYIQQSGQTATPVQDAPSDHHEEQQRNPREALMQSIAAGLLNLSDARQIDLDIPLTQQGVGSLSAVEFCQEYEVRSGEEVSISQFFNYPSIRELAQALNRSTHSHACLDALFRESHCDSIKELHALRHYLLHNRFPTSGFRLGPWAVRPATNADVAAIHKLDQQEYGWLGEDATDDAAFIAHQVATLNGMGTPWFWLLERHHPNQRKEIVGWYIMQPTYKRPEQIKSWADATDHGRLTATFDPHSQYLYLVAGGVSREYSKQAHRLMVLNALSLMQGHQIKHVFACLAMPGFSDARERHHLTPEEYLQQTQSNGEPKDAFLAFFRELWPGRHLPFRLLRDGYPPDQHSGGHGVCACVEIDNHQQAIEAVFNKLVAQKAELFGDNRAMPLREAAA